MRGLNNDEYYFDPAVLYKGELHHRSFKLFSLSAILGWYFFWIALGLVLSILKIVCKHVYVYGRDKYISYKYIIKTCVNKP